MNRTELIRQIKEKQSYLCIGLDTDSTKIPKHLQSLPDAVVQFNKAIIDATKDHCIGYKINTAFYEACGVKGWEILEQSLAYIPSTHFKIAMQSVVISATLQHNMPKLFLKPTHSML
jgi:orotidine-5'-phosphate decarboxylase